MGKNTKKPAAELGTPEDQTPVESDAEVAGQATEQVDIPAVLDHLEGLVGDNDAAMAEIGTLKTASGLIETLRADNEQAAGQIEMLIADKEELIGINKELVKGF